MASRQEDHHPREQAERPARLLQPRASPLLRSRRRKDHLPRRLVREHVLRQQTRHAVVRIQPDHVPPRPLGSAIEDAMKHALAIAAILVSTIAYAAPADYFGIQVIDEQTN